MQTLRLLPLTALLTASLMTGCATKVANMDYMELESQRDAAMADESAAKSIQRAQMNIELGKTEELAYYAPRHLKIAQDKLIESRSMHTSGDPDGEVKPVAIMSKKAIEAGLQTKKTVISTLRPALKHKEKLLEIKADKYYPEDYKKITATIVKLIDLIEDGNVSEAQRGQKALLPRMHANEVNTIEFIQLQPIKDQLAKIKKKGGDSIAPSSWKVAKKSLKQAQALIGKTPRAKKQILQATHDAQRAADHANIITDFANEINDANSDNAEAIALRVERWLYRVSVALKHDDIRHRPFDEQAATLSTEVEKIMRQSR
ncbi:MAG: hypothetical protein JKY50_15610 [Oleispira sp.]|nr:hypothetical protein [Oleispira sp.]MBL4880315.1 hypothetical protein [Oleispira sp.]